MILSRSFCNDILFSDRPDREEIFVREVKRLRSAEAQLLREQPAFFAENHRLLRSLVAMILEGKP